MFSAIEDNPIISPSLPNNYWGKGKATGTWSPRQKQLEKLSFFNPPYNNRQFSSP